LKKPQELRLITEKLPRCPRGLTSPDILCVKEYLCYDECWSATDGWQEKTPERQGRRRLKLDESG